MKTIQLRRYEIEPGQLNDFVTWWSGCMPDLRASFNFTIEFAYVDEGSNQFIWAVSLPVVTEDEFTALDKAYQTSDARAQVFDGVPQRVKVSHLSFVKQVFGN